MMRRALERIAAVQGAQRAREVEPFLMRVAKMEGAGRLFKRIAEAGDSDAIDDHLAPARYALMFAGLGFMVGPEPTGAKGPDLSIARDGYSAAVEVTRFRKEPADQIAEARKALPAGLLQEYGDPMRYVERRIRDKVMDKFRQLRQGTGVLALWNDDDELQELEMSQALGELAEEGVAGTLQVPPGLYLIVYASWGVPAARPHVRCFELQPNCPPHLRQWKADLESSLVRDLLRRAISA